MSRSKKQRAWKILLAAAVLFALLLALLPHFHHLTVPAACPVLSVVFLFGVVPVPYSLWLPSQAHEEHLPQSPDLPSRFQRPPPTTV